MGGDFCYGASGRRSGKPEDCSQCKSGEYNEERRLGLGIDVQSLGAAPNPSLVVGEVAQRVPQWMSLSSLVLNCQKSDFPLNRLTDENKIANYQQKRLNKVGSGLCHHESALQTFTPLLEGRSNHCLSRYH